MTTNELSFTGNTTDYNTTATNGNTTTSGQIYDIIVGSTISDPSLVGSIDWMVAESGVNFLSFKLELYAPLTNFAVGAINTVYFQIEHPVVKEEEVKKRLLAEKAEDDAPLVKGTGMYEGLITSYQLKTVKDKTVTPMLTNDMWGNTKLSSKDN